MSNKHQPKSGITDLFGAASFPCHDCITEGKLENHSSGKRLELSFSFSSLETYANHLIDHHNANTKPLQAMHRRRTSNPPSKDIGVRRFLRLVCEKKYIKMDVITK